MTQTARSIAHERGSTHDVLLAGIHATIRFDVEGVGTWCLRIDDGRADLVEGAAPADLTIYCDERVFVGVIRGETSLLTAVLRGDAEVVGDLSLAFRFHGLPQPSAGAEVSP